MTLTYPPPEENPNCKCKDSTLAAFFCDHGHILECHYPFTCSQAACSHLHNYDLSREEKDRLTDEVRAAIERGERKPYRVDEHGNVWIEYCSCTLGDGPTAGPDNICGICGKPRRT